MKENIRLIIKELDRSLLQLPTICQKGCSYCCYQAATVADYEEIPIKTFIKKRLSLKMKSSVRKNAVIWLERYEQIYDEVGQTDLLSSQEEAVTDKAHLLYHAASMKLAQERIPCPFLINSRCAIYQVRPLACRIHGQTEDLDACQMNLLRENAVIFKDTAESYFQRIKTVLQRTSQFSTGEPHHQEQGIVVHRHLIPTVRQDVMINRQMRHSPALRIKL